MVRLIDRFVKDSPPNVLTPSRENFIPDCIEGCSAVALAANEDERGWLVELLTTRDHPTWPIVHTYQVFARAGSLRGWVYHDRQFDRLAFTAGHFRVVLHDLREESPTFGKTNTVMAGEDRMALLTIAPFVAHCVENVGDATACFVNMPTRAYDPGDPDKFRLPVSAGLIPYPGR
ncbi:MAG: dTDP-4-dehydrorhamnose 3,5-epimerase family protein [Bauldia sp.]